MSSSGLKHWSILLIFTSIPTYAIEGHLNELFSSFNGFKASVEPNGQATLVNRSDMQYRDTDTGNDLIQTSIQESIKTVHQYSNPKIQGADTTRHRFTQYDYMPRTNYVIQMDLDQGDRRGISDQAKVLRIADDGKLERLTYCQDAFTSKSGLGRIKTKYCMSYTKDFCRQVKLEEELVDTAYGGFERMTSDQTAELATKLESKFTEWSRMTDGEDLEKINHITEGSSEVRGTRYSRRFRGQSAPLQTEDNPEVERDEGLNFAAKVYIFQHQIVAKCNWLTNNHFFTEIIKITPVENMAEGPELMVSNPI